MNDSALLRNFKPHRGIVKGVNGRATSFAGSGRLTLCLRSYCGGGAQVVVKGVYVPNCLYNLLSPQLLVSELKHQGMSAQCQYNNERHTIAFTDDGGPKLITSFAKPNNLFSIRVNEGFQSFFCHAVNIEPKWCSFAGALHVIPSNDDNSVPLHQHQGSSKLKESSTNLTNEGGPGQTNEPAGAHVINDETTDVHVINNENYPLPLANLPRVTEFSTQDTRLGPEDPAMIILRRKQSRLATIHERLGHLSFGKLCLLARAKLIPGDLATVPPPTCPGCAYGKAHRKPIRHKGKRHHLRGATKPGEVVSMDQISTPTAGFVPTHRGIPTTSRYI